MNVNLNSMKLFKYQLGLHRGTSKSQRCRIWYGLIRNGPRTSRNGLNIATIFALWCLWACTIASRTKILSRHEYNMSVKLVRSFLLLDSIFRIGAWWVCMKRRVHSLQAQSWRRKKICMFSAPTLVTFSWTSWRSAIAMLERSQWLEKIEVIGAGITSYHSTCGLSCGTPRILHGFLVTTALAIRLRNAYTMNRLHQSNAGEKLLQDIHASRRRTSCLPCPRQCSTPTAPICISHVTYAYYIGFLPPNQSWTHACWEIQLST